MRPAAEARHTIEGLIRPWFALMTPAERAQHGALLVAMVAAQMRVYCDPETTADLFYQLADQIVAATPPGAAR